MKQKMFVIKELFYLFIFFSFSNRFSLNDKNSSISRICFYGDNQYIRNKTNLLTLNESARKYILQ